jgi:hypothetical protein
VLLRVRRGIGRVLCRDLFMLISDLRQVLGVHVGVTKPGSRIIGRLPGQCGRAGSGGGDHQGAAATAGSVFVPAARRVLAEAARARAEVDEIAGARRGHIRIGTNQTASRRLGLAALLGGFSGLHPEVTIAVSTGPRQELLDALSAAELNLVLASDGQPRTASIPGSGRPPSRWSPSSAATT